MQSAGERDSLPPILYLNQFLVPRSSKRSFETSGYTETTQSWKITFLRLQLKQLDVSPKSKTQHGGCLRLVDNLQGRQVSTLQPSCVVYNSFDTRDPNMNFICVDHCHVDTATLYHDFSVAKRVFLYPHFCKIRGNLENRQSWECLSMSSHSFFKIEYTINLSLL